MVFVSSTFVINDYIELKLEDDKTVIYIEGKEFIQCKYLSITSSEANFIFSEIESIDDFSEDIGLINSFEISPDIEFWGHCSNLQAWYEHNYDTTLLHSNLAFPLLKELYKIGDPIANFKFKEEIVKRFSSNRQITFEFLLIEDYLKYLGIQEVKFLLDTSNFIESLLNCRAELLENIRKTIQYMRKKFPNILRSKVLEIFRQKDYRIIELLFIRDLFYDISDSKDLLLIINSKIEFFEVLLDTIEYSKHDLSLQGDISKDIYYFFQNLDQDYIPIIKYAIEKALKRQDFRVLKFLSEYNLFDYFTKEELDNL